VEAPFPLRPDTVVRGDLRGPFNGRVVEAGSGKPVEGATVLGSWAFETGRGLVGPADAVSATTETDADGRYEIDAVPAPRDGRWRIARFTLVVYKRGYLAWRSDRRFADLQPRRDFAQTGNQVKLEALPGDLSHTRHLLFIGASGPLLNLLGAELAIAADEAAHPETAVASAGAAPKVAPLDPGRLLSVDELKAVTGYNGAFTEEPLPDVAPSPIYGSVHFKAVGQPERYDAAIRVYRLNAQDDPDKRFAGLLADLPAATETNEVGDRSLRSREGDIYGVAVLEREHRMLLVFTCGNGLCADFDTALGLVKRMVPRLGRLLRPSEAQP
jgi:hypothetical protein